MRALSTQELELVVGGYDSREEQTQVDYVANDDVYDVSAGADMSAAQADNINHAMNTMGEEDLNVFANQTAQDFGIPVGPFRVTPIFNPFSGPNDIRYGVRARARC